MLKLIVKFEKIGNKIKYTLPVKMFCTRMNTELPNSQIFEKTDGLYRTWLGKNIDSLFKKRSVIYRKVLLNQIYDSCDVPKSKN